MSDNLRKCQVPRNPHLRLIFTKGRKYILKKTCHLFLWKMFPIFHNTTCGRVLLLELAYGTSDRSQSSLEPPESSWTLVQVLCPLWGHPCPFWGHLYSLYHDIKISLRLGFCWINSINSIQPILNLALNWSVPGENMVQTPELEVWKKCWLFYMKISLSTMNLKSWWV